MTFGKSVFQNVVFNPLVNLVGRLNNRKSGGKVLSSHVPKGSNRVATALRMAAESVGKQKDAPLYPFFQRILH